MLDRLDAGFSELLKEAPRPPAPQPSPRPAPRPGTPPNKKERGGCWCICLISECRSRFQSRTSNRLSPFFPPRRAPGAARGALAEALGKARAPARVRRFARAWLRKSPWCSGETSIRPSSARPHETAKFMYVAMCARSDHFWGSNLERPQRKQNWGRQDATYAARPSSARSSLASCKLRHAVWPSPRLRPAAFGWLAASRRATCLLVDYPASPGHVKLISGSLASWLPGFLASWLPGFLASWLADSPSATFLPGSLLPRQPGTQPRQP